MRISFYKRHSQRSIHQELAEGVEAFVEKVEANDSLHYIKDIMKEIDMDKMLGIADDVYAKRPILSNR